MSWLIESVVSGRCVGMCDGRMKLTSPELAIRFERKDDAEAIIRYMDLRVVGANRTPGLSLEAREHLFEVKP